jgi:hypothetical protein
MGIGVLPAKFSESGLRRGEKVPRQASDASSGRCGARTGSAATAVAASEGLLHDPSETLAEGTDDLDHDEPVG